MKTLIGIDKTLQENNYQMLVANANQTTGTEIQAIENFIKQKVAGIILLTKTLTNEHQKIMANSNIPILFVGQEYKDQYCLVHDDYDAAYELGGIRFIARPSTYCLFRDRKKMIFLLE